MFPEAGAFSGIVGKCKDEGPEARDRPKFPGLNPPT